MSRIYILFVATVMVFIFTSWSYASTVTCADYNTIVERLNDDGQTLSDISVTDKATIQIFVNKATTDYTVIVQVDDLACYLGSGSGYSLDGIQA